MMALSAGVLARVGTPDARLYRRPPNYSLTAIPNVRILR